MDDLQGRISLRPAACATQAQPNAAAFAIRNSSTCVLVAGAPAHALRLFEETFGPTALLVATLSGSPRLAEWHRDHDRIAADFFSRRPVAFRVLADACQEGMTTAHVDR